MTCIMIGGEVRREARVREVGVGAGDAVDFFGLAGAELFGGVEAPGALEEALAAEDFVDAGDAADEAVGGVEDGGVGVGELGSEGKEGCGDGAGLGRAVAFLKELHGGAGPDGPLAEESADDAAFDGPAARVEPKGSEEVGYDVVVVAGVKGDIVAAGFDEGADDVDGLVAIEGGDFDGDDVFDFGEAVPERMAEEPPANGWLQVKADQGKMAGQFPAVGDEGIVICVAQCPKTQQSSVIPEFAGEVGLGDCLGGGAADTGDADGMIGLGIEIPEFGGGEFEDGAEQAVLADGELGGVDANGEAARARGVVIANKGALADLVKAALGVQGQGTGGDDQAFLEAGAPH